MQSFTRLAVHAVFAVVVALTTDWVGPVLLLLVSFVWLCLAVAARSQKNPVFLSRGAKAAIYGMACIVSFAVLSNHRADDEAAARTIFGALNNYRLARGAYPQSLAGLIPEHLPSIPRAHNSRFLYSAGGDEFRLTYVDMPPGGSRSYDSKTKQWVAVTD